MNGRNSTGRSVIGRVPVDIDKQIRRIMDELKVSYPTALREFANRQRGIINWKL